MRAAYLDNLRGVAVIWMVIFHFCYDLRNLGFVDWSFSTGFWFAFPRVIAFTFLFCVGISLNYVHIPRINWRALKERALKLGLAALAISVSTYFLFPTQWIYFGTLHCIFAGSILGTLVVNYRRVAFVILILILIAQYGLDYDINWVATITKRDSMDFIPIYPWFWAVLLGILTGPYLERIKMPKVPFLALLSRHSLKIYLIHQPLLYGIILGLKALL
jgi:uncharacterized membrane protein